MAIMMKVSFLTRRKTKGFLKTRKRKEIIKKDKDFCEGSKNYKRKKFKNIHKNKKHLHGKIIR
jgi:hypothetical protein